MLSTAAVSPVDPGTIVIAGVPENPDEPEAGAWQAPSTASSVSRGRLGLMGAQFRAPEVGMATPTAAAAAAEAAATLRAWACCWARRRCAGGDALLAIGGGAVEPWLAVAGADVGRDRGLDHRQAPSHSLTIRRPDSRHIALGHDAGDRTVRPGLGGYFANANFECWITRTQSRWIEDLNTLLIRVWA